MEFTEVVRGRRAVRQYASTRVAVNLLRDIIDLAVWAPSAMNRQPWEFAVLDDAARIEEWAVNAKQYYLSHEEVTNTVRAQLESPAYSIFHHAPALVLVVAKSDSEQAREDCCLAAQTLMLAARNHGLGSCWIGFARPWLNIPETRTMLKLPPDPLARSARDTHPSKMIARPFETNLRPATIVVFPPLRRISAQSRLEPDSPM